MASPALRMRSTKLLSSLATGLAGFMANWSSSMRRWSSSAEISGSESDAPVLSHGGSFFCSFASACGEGGTADGASSMAFGCPRPDNRASSPCRHLARAMLAALCPPGRHKGG
eukprot:3442532-Prymnesium_polylepis.2